MERLFAAPPAPRRLALITLSLGAAIALAMPGSASAQTTFFWDPDLTAAGNNVDGTGLGGGGTWDTATTAWWDGSTSVLWPNLDTSIAVFSGPFVAPGIPTPSAVTISSGIVANGLSFARSGYTLAGGDITLDGANPTLRVTLGESATINSQILGSDGLTLTGGGVLRLGNSSNAYTGTTTVTSGTLIISNAGALGASTDAVIVSDNNPVATDLGIIGYQGGNLVLDGSAGGFTFSRDLVLSGAGTSTSRGSSLLSFGNNTLSGLVDMANGATKRNTRVISTNGALTFAGTLNVGGTAGTTISSLGGVNTGGVPGNFALSGALTGTGTLEKSGAGVLVLNPSDSSGFSGRLRISSSAASGQSSVRVSSADVFGTANGTNASAPIDMNAGILEVRADGNLAIAKNVFLRASSTFFADHAIGGQAINGTVEYGNFRNTANLTATFNSRNGYGMTFGAVTAETDNEDSTFTNNMAGLLTFNGNFWGVDDAGGPWVLSMAGNGNTLITGNILAIGNNHTMTKSGSGLLTVNGTASTISGNISVTGGALAIRDFRSVNDNAAQINLGSGTTATSLIIGTDQVASAAGLITDKVINLAGSTGGASIYANQTGANPVVLNADFNATGGSSSQAKTLSLGGTSTVDNTILGIIRNNNAGGTVNVLKTGPGTWVLAGANTYTGSTTINGGTLKIQDTFSGASRNVIASTGAVTFTANATTGEAGGTLEYRGDTGSASSESLGTLTLTDGANTIQVTNGSGGTAALTFSAAATINNDASANFISSGGNSITVTGQSGYNPGRLYFNGADFAFFDTGVVRAPVYGTDTNFAAANTFTSNNHALITADSATAAITQRSVKLLGNVTLTLNGNLSLNNAASNTAGNILATGGNAVISGSGGITGPGSSVLGIRVDGSSDTLTINSNVIGGTGGLNKNGAGRLVLNGTGNTITGEYRINEGEIELGAGARLGGNGTSTFNALSIRNTGVLDVGGNAIGVDALNGSGIITNDGAATTITVGNTNGTGTWAGIFQNGTGALSVTKVGTGAQTWTGLSTYTGVTTIGSTGLVTVDRLANIGVASGIGAGDSTDDASNAASLVFNGSTSGLVYTGSLREGSLVLGATSATTDRLFTLAGTGVTLSSTAANNNAIVWSNQGAIVHGIVGPQSVIFTGTSQGDNTFNPQLTDSGTGLNITSVTKTGTGIWRLGNGNNTYSGPTTITQGILMATDGDGLSSNSNLVFDGGTLYTQGTFSRDIGTGAGQMQFAAPVANTAQFSGGFLGGDSKLTVDWTGTPVWGGGAGFLDNRDGLMLNGSQARAQGATGSIALSEVEIAGDFSLGTANHAAKALVVTTTNSSATVTVTTGDTSGLVVGQSITGDSIPSGAYIVSINSATTFTISANVGSTAGQTGANVTVLANQQRTIRVDDNGNTGADFATISGVISGNAGSGLRKTGTGTLVLTGANTYDGETTVNQGTLAVTSLGNSAVAGTSSVGTTTNANLDSNAINLGNGGSGAGILQYIGAGETSDRKIRFNTTTGSTQIHADGTGALILTNVANDMVAGVKTLFLRGTNTAGNMITSTLANNGADNLNVTVDGAATWILAGNNTYGGTTTVTSGALGIGHNNALGTSAVVLASTSGGVVFAYGGDRVIGNAISEVNSTGSITTFAGDHSLTFNGDWTNPTTSSSGRFTRNNIVSGKTLTINGNYTFTAVTSGTVWNFDGSGDTIINGIISNSQGNIGITYRGTGSLTLGGANAYTNNTTVTSGTLRLSANEVIPDGTGKGNLVFNGAAGVSATFDLNGVTETVNGLTANQPGIVVIDNTSATAASFTFGANDAAVDFGSGLGSYTIQNSGGGALSITKTGASTATFSTGMNLNYTGSTNVTGGSFTIASMLNGTTALSATSASTLALTGGLANAGLVTSIVVDHGSTMSFLDGAGNKFTNLTNLQLGSNGGTLTTLNMNVGDVNVANDQLATDLINLTSGGTLGLFAGNDVRFNLTDIGLNANQTYTLMTSANGGFTSGPLAATDWVLGGTPGGFDSIILNVTDNLISVTTGNLVVGDLYWRGLTDNTWNGALDNWSQDKAGASVATTTPGQGTDVIFVSDAVSNAPLTTTLEQNFKVNSLTFEASTVPANTPSSVTINPGVNPNARLEISPQLPTDGLSIAAGGPVTVAINTALRLGAAQTWNVTDAGSTLTIGNTTSGVGLMGEADITKTGDGRVVLVAAADPTFNVGQTADVVINAGTLEIQHVGALGSTANANLANIVINPTGVFYYNGAAGTVANDITLAGGTLSAGGGTQIYSDSVLNVTANSFINMSENNGLPTGTVARSITLPGQLMGTGSLTVNSVNTVTEGNQETGTLTLSGDNSGWSGGLNMVRGTVTASHANALGTGDITASGGRIIFAAPGGSTFNVNNITVDGVGGVLEITADASGTPASDMAVNINGVITLGSAANANNALRITQSTDNFSIFNIANSVVLANNASISVSGATSRPVTISGIISETGGARNLTVNAGGWTTQTVLRLTGANTFTGNLAVNGGTLEFDTVTNAGGAASSLGQGNAITMGAATLRFIGGTSQSTDRPITATGAITLGANGTGGASITYNGAIATGANSWTLTGLPGSEGFITTGIATTGAADANVTGGTWTITGTTTSVGDDFNVNGTSTILNLNNTNAVTYNPAGSASAELDITNGGTVNLGANNAINSADFDSLLVGQSAGGATAVLNLNSFNQAATGLILGERATDRVGLIDGTGTLTIGATGIDLYRGEVNANLASGATSLEKLGSGTVTLRGDNSGLGAGAIVHEGTLILDYASNLASKLRVASNLDMRGGTLVIDGHATSATSQTVTGFTLGSGGSSTIDINAGTGGAVLNLGAITRANASQDGTLRIILPAGAQSATNGITTSTGLTNGLVGSSAFATVDDGTGLHFATLSGTNIVALQSTVNNDISSWVTGSHVTDDGAGYTGSTNYASINSLRFDAAGGSDVLVNAPGVLGIATGGVLVTSNVTGAGSIMGGTLTSGATEVIVTHEGSQLFEIGSDIRANNAFTKTGLGTVLLSGNNVYSGSTDVHEGLLQVSGGNAIGDNSLVTLGVNRPSTLQLLADETIGRLQGGQVATNSMHGVVDLGSHRLTINNSGSNTIYAGVFVGNGDIIRQGTHNLNVTGVSSSFTGNLIVNSGLFHISGDLASIAASSFTLNKGASFLLDNNATSNNITRIADTADFTLNSADGSGQGETIVRGLWARNDDDDNSTEVIGTLNVASGASYVTLNVDETDVSGVTGISTGDWVRSNSATLNVRGENLGVASGNRTQFKIVNGTIEDAFLASSNLVGGIGGAGTATRKIIPWAIGQNVGATGNVSDVIMGNSLVTYVDNVGIVALDLNTEYATYATAGAENNTRESLTADLTGLAGRTVNSLVLHNANATAATHNVTGTGAGQALAVTSGALLFTNQTTTAGEWGIALGGFDDGITTGTGEYVFHVVNPSSAANTANLTATINSPLTSAADITKSGRGVLVLTGSNTAGGGAQKTTLNEGTLVISDLDNIGGGTGNLVFAGGTLMLSSTYSGDDLSTRSISFLTGGGTLHTNGIDLALTGSLGSGVGGFTKSGTGNLTLGAAATYTGATTVNGGTLTIGANNATGNGGNLNVTAATLALGANNISAGLVTTSGLSPSITGPGTITASTGFFFNHTGDTQIDAVLAGNGGLLKAQTNIVTLTGANTFTGPVEVHAGTLSFNSVGNIGGGPSSLGNPTTSQNGVIHMGLTTAATVLNYTGSGSSSNRLIGMQGTTGAVTLDADGTGALTLGGVIGEMFGNKTLTLQGSSDASINNTLGAIRDLGTISVLKTEANTWVLNGANSYLGATSINNGILRMTADQNMAGGLNFGSADTITTAGTLDLTNASATFAGAMLVQTNSTTNTNQLLLGASQTLTINNNVTIGGNGTASTTLFTATGGGAMIVNNAAANALFAVGGNDNAGNRTVADLSGLDSLTIDINTTNGIVRVNPNNGTNVSNFFSTLLLPTTGSGTTTVTAATLAVGDGGQNNIGSINELMLGSGANTFNVNTVNIGTGIRDVGSIAFSNTNGSLVVNAADGIGRTAFNMGTGSATTGITGIENIFDVTGHQANLLLGAVNIGTQNRNSNLTNTFSFDTGTLDMLSLTMSTKGSNGNTTDSTMNLGGGTVNIGSGSGTAITLATASGAGTAVATMNMTGGAITVLGDVVRGADAAGGGTATGTINLNGAALNLSNFTVGTAANQIVFNAQSGTLSNLAELNGGGALDKTTAGTLILTGTNAYTGQTNVQAGVARATSNSALGNVSAGTVVSSGAALELSGGLTIGAEALSLDGTGVAGGGALRSVAGANTYGGAITLAGNSRINSDADLLTLDVSSGDAITGATFGLAFGGAGDGVVSDNMSGLGAVTKDGTGSWTIDGDATTGATTINAGTFTVNGNYDSTGGFTVESGATLLGSGTIVDDLTLNSGFTASPGNSPGQMDVAGNMTWNGSTGLPQSTQVFDINDVDALNGQGTNWDYWDVLGSLTINGSATSTISIDINSFDITNTPGDAGFNPLSSYTWLWATAAGGVTLNGGTLDEIFTFNTNDMVGFDSSLGSFSVVLGSGVGTSQSLSIQYTAVPEPGSMLLCGLAAAGLAAYGWRRRRNRQAAQPHATGEESAELTLSA